MMRLIRMILVAAATLVAVVNAQRSPPSPPIGIASPTPAPAPAPTPKYVNITELLSVAGPFKTFLNYLVTSKVIDTLQNQANNTEEGVTVFVPKDDAFKSLKNPSLSNLTADQLKSLCLFHALPHYYTLAEFRNLSESGPITTFSGGQYTMNFTDVSGTVHINTGWTRTKVSSSVFATDPIAIYQVDRVLLPEAIFGTDIPPMPAPAPAPDVAPTADSPDQKDGSGSSSSSSSPTDSPSSSSSLRIINTLSSLILAMACGIILMST